MFKLSTLIMSLGVTLATAFSASADEFTLGYAHGNNTDAIALEYTGTNAEVSAAIYITPELAKVMSGDDLTGVTFYMFNRVGVKSCKVWVRETLDDANVAESEEILPASLQFNKWNNFHFTTTYPISDKGFYIGVTWQQSKACKLISFIETPNLNASWTKIPNQAWTNGDITGTLCIEGLVSGDNRSAFDAALMRASFGKYYLVNKSYIQSEFTVYNHGTQQIDGLTIELGIEGLDPVDVNLDTTIPAGQEVSIPVKISLPIHTDDPSKYTINYAKITKLDNGTDEFTGNNELKDLGTFTVLMNSYNKRVLLEEFTGESCPNCPAAANLLHQLLQLPEYKDNIDAVCHHTGYYDDNFTLSTDSPLGYLYNIPEYGGTFAPAFAIDRVPVRSYDQQTAKYYMAPAFFPSPTSLVTNLLDQQKEEVALSHVDIDFDVPGEHDKKLNVTFTAKRLSDILDNDGRLTVYLVEDNVKAISQANAPAGFLHQHVTRQTNSTWGEPIVWDDNNEFTYTFEFTLGTSYKLEDLRIVAVINEYNTMNYNGREIPDCQNLLVYNSNYKIVATGEGPTISGIHDNLIDKTATIKAIYDLNGVQHNDFVEGINVVIMSDGTTHKIVK